MTGAPRHHELFSLGVDPHVRVIVVTEHGQPVAELRPIDGSDDAVAIALRRMADEGVLTRPTRDSALTPFAPIKLPRDTPSIAKAISKGREDRF